MIANIGDAAALEECIATLDRRIKEQGFERKQVPMVIQPMVRSQFELILGVTHEPGLGHFLVAGFGGIHTEALDEVTLISIPASDEDIRRKLAGSKVGRVLSRLKGANDPLALTVNALVALQAVIATSGDLVELIDVNPFLIGEKCIAVDALIVPRAPAT